MNQNEPLSLATAPKIESLEIIGLLGKGGMSLVYKARQEKLDRIVAVKVLSKLAVRGEDGIRRFQKEARLTSSLDHPNIVKTIAFGVSKDEQPYLVMEFTRCCSASESMFYFFAPVAISSLAIAFPSHDLNGWSRCPRQNQIRTFSPSLIGPPSTIVCLNPGHPGY